MPLKSSMKILLVDAAATNRQSLKKVFTSPLFKYTTPFLDELTYTSLVLYGSIDMFDKAKGTVRFTASDIV